MMEQQQQQQQEEEEEARAHVLAIPFPAQGHVNPFMQLCKILARNQVMVTFANTDYIHKKLNLGEKQQENGWIGQPVQMVSYPDGLPAEHGRVQQLQELYEALYANVPKHMDSIIAGAAHPPISAIICDAVFSFAADLARRHGVPCILFRTCSACGFSAFHHTSLLLRQNYLPLSEEKQERQGMMERAITCVPGLESLRVRDLPSFMLTHTHTDNIRSQCRIRGIGSERGASLLLMNTWQELETAVLNQLQTAMDSNLQVLAIGPLLLLLDQGKGTSTSVSVSLWTEDTACMKWLHSQKPDSVLYVSFGSIAVMGQRQLEELAWGLAGSGQPFLWVIRPDLGQAGSTLALPAQFVEEMEMDNHGMIVEWAPQMQVLQHPSVGGFLSHGGWNSVVESMCAGVPLMCWPFFAEQAVNARFVGHVWKVGLHVEDRGEVVERGTVAHMVRELMCAEQALCLRRNAKTVQQSAMSSVFGGSSQANMNRLLQFLKAPPAGAS